MEFFVVFTVAFCTFMVLASSRPRPEPHGSETDEPTRTPR